MNCSRFVYVNSLWKLHGSVCTVGWRYHWWLFVDGVGYRKILNNFFFQWNHMLYDTRFISDQISWSCHGDDFHSPPRSYDLIPLDFFFFCGTVWRKKTLNVQLLNGAAFFENVVKNFTKRMVSHRRSRTAKSVRIDGNKIRNFFSVFFVFFRKIVKFQLDHAKQVSWETINFFWLIFYLVNIICGSPFLKILQLLFLSY